jgi:pimeloyl-ACP methyl ester carboxylesterase
MLRMKRLGTGLVALSAFAVARGVCAQEPVPTVRSADCSRVASLSLPETTITRTDVVEGPSFEMANGRTLDGLPAFCLVAAITEPAVRFEVWLPLVNWNGKFQGVGNGAQAGQISYPAMATALRRGYAVASTDTGHATSNARDAKWAIGHAELVVDFGYRAVHVMTMNAKSITQAFYGERPRQSYFVACSTGGRQGLMEAQRYPDDYDGLVAGAPAANWTHFQTGGHLWAALVLNKDPESYVPATKLPLLERAVNAACDTLDGVADGVLEDPRRCNFDARELVCRQGRDPMGCLTPKQAVAINSLWTGPRNSRGEQIYPPYMRGAEAQGGWKTYSTGTEPLTGSHWAQAQNTVGYMIFEKPDWDFRTFDYDRDVPFAETKLGKIMDAFDPDLSALRKHGGRLLLYHGWNDPSISPLNTINYYERAVSAWRAQEKAPSDAVPDFIRLFMVPGMLHCSGGPGTDTFDALGALEAWMERGEAPDEMQASHVTDDGVVTRTRPLCAYPKLAVYAGVGSTDIAGNFTCKNTP